MSVFLFAFAYFSFAIDEPMSINFKDQSRSPSPVSSTINPSYTDISSYEGQYVLEQYERLPNPPPSAASSIKFEFDMASIDIDKNLQLDMIAERLVPVDDTTDSRATTEEYQTVVTRFMSMFKKKVDGDTTNWTIPTEQPSITRKRSLGCLNIFRKESVSPSLPSHYPRPILKNKFNANLREEKIKLKREEAIDVDEFMSNILRIEEGKMQQDETHFVLRQKQVDEYYKRQ